MADEKGRFPTGSGTFFFDRSEFDVALGELTRKLRERAAIDGSWLPPLISLGGFQYERGRREFGEWADSIRAILRDAVADLERPYAFGGDAAQILLRESWEAIPRSVAERFGAALRAGMADMELVRLGRAYKQLQLSFRQSGGQRIIEMMSELARLNAVAPLATAESPVGISLQENEVGEDGRHRHDCSACGMCYEHESWECEPPDDRYCPMCAENVGGGMPIWIERIADLTAAANPSLHEAAPEPLMPNAISRKEECAPDSRTSASSAKPASPAGGVQTVSEAPPEDIGNGSPNPTRHGLAKVGGMDELKALLYDEIVTAMRDPEDLEAYGLTIPNGILLFGPPGCGKTFITRALAEELGFYFAEVFPSEIGSTFIHGTTLKIREVFDGAAERAPSIIFVDEFEGMVPARRELAAHQHQTAEEVSEFLKQLETCSQRRILLMAATNEPWKIDPAVQRTGRLDKRIYVGAPDAAARATILRFHLYGRRQVPIHVEELARSLEGYSAADIKVLVDEAARLARKQRQPIGEEHLRKAARERVPPSITAQDELRFRAFEQRGVDGPRRSSHVILPDDPQARAVPRNAAAAAMGRRTG